MRASLVVTVLLALGCARGPNVASDELPLKRVVVYRNGVGYFERAGRVDTDEVHFRMKKQMVGDFLATLAIVERGGSTVRSASFPLEIVDEEKPEPPDGDPRLRSMLKPIPEPPPESKSKREMRDVVLRLDGGEHDLAIGYVVETPVWRASYRLVINENGNADLQAWGIVQNLSGEDWNDVKLALVAGAPIAFESTLGDPVIPVRPIVTDSGEVITAVPGSETTLEEKADRDSDGVADTEDEPAAAEGEKAGSGGARDTAARPSRTSGKKSAASSAAQPAPPPPPMAPQPGMPGRGGAAEQAQQAMAPGPSAPRNLSQLAAVAIETGTTRYEIPNAVTVPNESATMVLLVSKRVPGEAVFLFAPDPGVAASQAHPFRVVRFTNATRGLLERGPIAVFEKGSFLGQGVVEPLPPRAVATVPFALERSLAVESERKYDQEGARLHRIESGALFIERDAVLKTTYRVKNGARDRAKLLVRHARLAGSRLHAPPTGTEDNTGTGSALVPIAVNGHARAELVVDERSSVQQQADWLSPLADDAVKAYLQNPRAEAPAVARLTEAWRIREVLVRAVDEQNKLEVEQQELESSANETRLSLRAIEKNAQAADLRQKLTKRLGELSTRMDQVTKRLIELKMTVSEQQVRFRDAIREIKILKAPPPPDAARSRPKPNG